uniref:DDT domain-containing protein n=1 Tax=Leersia perrieri TaxID=77586 RepID=A0A0D9WEV8_9ORYZ
MEVAVPEVICAGEVVMVPAQEAGAKEVAAVVAKKQGKKAAAKRKSGESKGVPVGGSGISDPEKDNRKTCHQCRQRTINFSGSCHNMKKGKMCTILYCRKCLINRYGAEEHKASMDDTWTCPKCRDICNCSLCMKKKGLQPTGILAHAAKASGCASVHHLLKMGDDAVAAAQSTQKARSAPAKKKQKKELVLGAAADPLVEGDENVCIDFNAFSAPIKKQKRTRKVYNGAPLVKDESPDAPQEEVVLPKGIPVTNVAGAEWDSDDVGSALQFFEFCRTFAEIFQVRKGQPERILRDIAGGRGLRVVSSIIADFHITLLSIIQEDRGIKPVTYSRETDTWIVDVGVCLSESGLAFDSLRQGVSGYKNLSPSCKLRILNFLCDESLSTEKLRNYILPPETKKPSREKVQSAKEKEDPNEETIKSNTDELMLLQTEGAAVSQHKDAKEVKNADKNEKKHGGFVRTNPVVVNKAEIYWKLDDHCNNTTMMLQEVDADDLLGNKDKWFMLNEDEEKIVENYAQTQGEKACIILIILSRFLTWVKVGGLRRAIFATENLCTYRRTKNCWRIIHRS